jgi:hypothetical protein
MESETSEPKSKKAGFWRLGLGLILLLPGLKNLDPIGPAELKPANVDQAFGYYGVTAAFILLGLFLILRGIQNLRRKPGD